MTQLFKAMMVLIGAVLALGIFSTCHAESNIVLEGEQCTNTKICYQVPNDHASSIDLYAVITHPYVFMYVDGVQYAGTLPGFYPYPSNIENLPMTDANGNVVYLTAEFESRRVCGGGGKGGGYCKVLWTLVGGEIVR